MIMSQNAPQGVLHNIDVASVLTPVQLVPNHEENQPLLKQSTYSE